MATVRAYSIAAKALAALFAGFALTSAAWAENAAFARSTGAKMRLDTRTGTRLAAMGASETITYSPRWNGGRGATALPSCTVTADGVTLKTASAEGEVSWSPDSTGAHTLTHTAGGETLTAQFTVLGDDVAQHAGSLAASETWGSNQVHLVMAAVTVPSGKTLTIECGAVVKFMTGTALTVNGTCTAYGVIFTHVNDDTAGGDTLMDGDATKPVMDGYKLTGNIYEDDATEERYTAPQTLTSSVSGTLRLKGHKVYLANSSITVNSGATLTLLPGAIIKFASGCSMTVNGTLDAQGTRAAPIVFTSQKDDAWGGDTNGDGEKTEEEAGDWHQITGSGTVKMNYCRVLWCSAQNNQGALYPNGGTWTFDNSIVAHCLYDCMRSYGGTFNANNSVFMDSSMGAAPSSGTCRFVNCVFNYLTTAVRWGCGSYYNCVFANISEDIIDTKFYSSTVNSPFGHCCFWAPNATGDKAAAKVGKDGNIWGDPKFVDPDNGDFRIAADSPCIDAGDGTGAPELDYYGRPRMDAKGKKATGVPNADGICPDIGIYEFSGKAIVPAADLAVLSVTAPSAAKIGEEMSLTYVVTNCGGATVSGVWRDVVSFVSGETSVAAEPVMTAGEIVAGGAAMTFTKAITVPAMQEGDWTIKVDVNAYRDVFESVVEDNNVMTAKTVTAVTMAAAGLDGELSGTVAFDRPYVVKFTVPTGEDYAAFISAPSGAEVAYGVGYMPLGAVGGGVPVGSGAYVSLPAGTTVYIQVTSGQGGEVKVTTQKAGLTVQSVSPGSFPQSGRVTASILGLHFASGATVELVNGADRIMAESVRTVSSERLQAEFDCEKLASGTSYALVVTQGEKKAELADAVTVQGVAGKANLTAKLDMPNALRQGRSFVFYIEYGNTGNLDLPAPVFTVVSDQMIFDTGTEKYDGSVKVLGLGAPGSEGVIRPGESFRLAVKAQVKASASSRSNVSYSLRASCVTGKDMDECLPLAKFFSDEYVYWTEGDAQIAEREAVAAKMGATWGEFYANLGGYLTALGAYGLATSDYEEMSQKFARHCVAEVREASSVKRLTKSAVRQVTAASATGSANSISLASIKAAKEEKLWVLAELDYDWEVPQNSAALRARTDRHNAQLAMDNSRRGDIWIWNGDWYRLYQPTNDSVSAYFNAAQPSVLICHGNLHSVHSSWVRRMAVAWKSVEPNSNILAVDWGDDATGVAEPSELLGWASAIPGVSGMASGFVHDLLDKPETAYATAVDIPAVSTTAYGYLKKAGVDPMRLTLIGHSHGGHVAGNIAGKFGLVARLIGMETSNLSSHGFVLPGEKFGRSWSKDNACVCEFYKTSYWMSMGSFRSDGASQVFGHYNFMVIPERAGRHDPQPAHFEHQWLLGSGTDYLLNMDADNAEGRMEAWRHDNVEEWFIETIVNSGHKWDGLGYGWSPSSCRKFGLPDEVPEHRYHGVISRRPGHEGLELARPDGWQGEWRYKEQILDRTRALSSALDDLQDNVTQTIEYRLYGDPNVPDVIDDDTHSISFVVKNGANNLCIDYDDVEKFWMSSKNEAWGPWQKDLGHVVWLLKETGSCIAAPERLSLSELLGLCDSMKIKESKIGSLSDFTRPQTTTTKKFSLMIPEEFNGSKISDEGEEFILLLGTGVSVEGGSPKDYFGDLCPSNNWYAKRVTVKPTKLRATIGLNGNDYEDGDTANILIGKNQTTVEFNVAAVAPGRNAKKFQWVSALNPDFKDETAESTSWKVEVPADKDHLLTAVTLIVSDDNGHDRTAMVLVRITRKTEEPGGDGYGNGSSFVPQSCDPNEMAGPLGIGDNRYVRPGDWMTYTIFFENKADAEAPAQFVTVQNELSEYLDWSTFEMMDVGFGTQIDLGLEGRQNGMSEVRMDGTNLSVRTEVAVDVESGLASWFLRIVTPYGDSEGWPYADDPTGFLPPNNPDTHCGEGHITYRIKVREDAPKGVRIDNSATIVFDYNDPIETDPAWWNTVANLSEVKMSLNGVETNLTLISGQPFGNLPTPAPRSGFAFNGWYTGEYGTGLKATPEAIVPEGDFSLYDYWIVGQTESYVVEFQIGEHGTWGGLGKTQTVSRGGRADASAFYPDPGWEASWSRPLDNITSNCTITAVYRRSATPIPVIGGETEADWYVDEYNGSDANDGRSPTSAFTSIQAAIDAAASGDCIVVNDGVYAPFEVPSGKEVTITGLNGYRRVIVDGGETNRCVTFPVTRSILTGVTLRKGSARTGGGVCYGTLTNCVLSGNKAEVCGGGAYVGRLVGCILCGNEVSGTDAQGGGQYGGDLEACLVVGNSAKWGGGASGCTLNRCTLKNNSASQRGGGAAASTLNNCLLIGNKAVYSGGGVDDWGYVNATCNNCTFVGNSAAWGEAANKYKLNNCVIWKCGAESDESSSVDGCVCNSTSIGVDPHFVDEANGDFRLREDSPCINAGDNGLVVGDVDLDGKWRISDGRVDQGAYEWQTTVTTYTVTYRPGAYGSGSPQTATKTEGVPLTLLGATFTRTGYTQTGWSKSSDGSTKDYLLNVSYTIDEAVTLYPYWTSEGGGDEPFVEPMWHFDANGGTGTMEDVTVLFSCLFPSNAFVREGYEFSGWARSPDATEAEWADGECPDVRTFEPTEDEVYVLYAVWREIVGDEVKRGSVGLMSSYDLVEDLGISIDADFAAGDKVTVKVETLPKGLKLVATPVYRDPTARTKVIVNYTYAITGVPTETLDFETTPMFVRVSVTKKDPVTRKSVTTETLQRAALAVEAATPQTLAGVMNADLGIIDARTLWSGITGKWTFKGWPAGVKYTAKPVKATRTAPEIPAFSIYGKPTKAGVFTVTATTPTKEQFFLTFTVWPTESERSIRYTHQAYKDVLENLGTAVAAASGLPTGLKFTAKSVAATAKSAAKSAGDVYGKPTKPGVYAVQLTLRDPSDPTGKKTLKAKQTILWQVTDGENPGLGAAEVGWTAGDVAWDGDAATATVRQGAAVNLGINLGALAAAAKVTVSGLPSGLKYDAKKGRITGVATKTERKVITVKVVQNGVTVTRRFAIASVANPFVGTFVGAVAARPADAPGAVARLAVAQVKVEASGKVTLTYTEGKTKYTASAKSYGYDLESGNGVVSGLALKVSSDDKKAGFGNRVVNLVLEDHGLYGLVTLDVRDQAGASLSDSPACYEVVKTTEVALDALQTCVFAIDASESLATVSAAYDAKKGTVAFAGKLFDSTPVKATASVCRWSDETGDVGDYLFAPFLVIGKDKTVYRVEWSPDATEQARVSVIDETDALMAFTGTKTVCSVGDRMLAELVAETGTLALATHEAGEERFDYAVAFDKKGKPSGVAIYDIDAAEGEKPLATVKSKLGKATGGVSFSFTSKKGDKAKYAVELVWSGERLLEGQVVRTWKEGRTAMTAYGTAELE